MLVSIHQKNIAQAFILERYFFVLKSAFFFETFGCARHNPSKLGFCSHLHESSRHGKAQTSLALLKIQGLLQTVYHKTQAVGQAGLLSLAGTDYLRLPVKVTKGMNDCVQGGIADTLTHGMGEGTHGNEVDAAFGIIAQGVEGDAADGLCLELAADEFHGFAGVFHGEIV